MKEQPHDLKLRTKAFALRIILKMADLLEETRQLIAIFTTIGKRSKAGL
jgi:hypothetical protein